MDCDPGGEPWSRAEAASHGDSDEGLGLGGEAWEGGCVLGDETMGGGGLRGGKAKERGQGKPRIGSVTKK